MSDEIEERRMPRTSRPVDRRLLDTPGPALSVPAYDPDALRPRVVHVGVGRFHRAHQARYLDDLAERGVSLDWGIAGVCLRTASTPRALSRQDRLYTVTEHHAGRPRIRVVGSLRSVDFAGGAHGTRLLARLADPAVALTTLTVTASAYEHPVGPGGAVTAFGLLAEALDGRRRAGLAPFTVLSCDNLPDNGRASRRAVLQAADRLRRPGLISWIERSVAFPASVVDRISVAADESAHRLLDDRAGLVDPCAVVSEGHREWVVEDAACGDMPPWDEVGVRVVRDVEPFWQRKAWLLNATHCALGYLGTPAGHVTTAGAMQDPDVRRFTRGLVDEVAAVLQRCAGTDAASYRADVLRRVADPALADPLPRLCRDGSVRMPKYVQPALVAALQQGRPHSHLVRLMAAWVLHLLTTEPEDLDDVRATELATVARTGDVHALIAHPAVWGVLPDSPRLRQEVAAAVAAMGAEARDVPRAS